jgi:thiamine-phosphate pyrophosphorylase
LLCYVTDRHALRIANPADSLPALIQKIEQVVAAGIDWVQIREKDLPARQLASLTRQALAIAAKYSATRSSPVRVLLNDRSDVAIAERANGVHLGENSLPAAEAKRLLLLTASTRVAPGEFLTGVSCHSLESAQLADRSGADYLFFGPTFATPSKEPFGQPQGLERLAQICRAVTAPVLAIGGITLQSAESCLAAGAAGIAAIRLFQDASEPSRVVQTLHRLVTVYPRQGPADHMGPCRP